MYKINKIIEDDFEYLPFLEETEIVNDFDELKPQRSVKLVADLYSAVMEREDYYQYNTPTMYGNPDFDYRCGVVIGMLKAGNIEEVKTDTQLIYKKGNRKILVVDIPQKPRSYYVSKREISQLRREFGI